MTTIFDSDGDYRVDHLDHLNYDGFSSGRGVADEYASAIFDQSNWQPQVNVSLIVLSSC